MLVLQNATNKGRKVSVSSIYDKVSAHIRALESLGVTTDNCATMLYPLVESSLPEETLRAWQRSNNAREAANAANAENEAAGAARKARLTQLMEFLKLEVENEERYDMVVNGFPGQGKVERREKVKDTREHTASTNEVSSASVLFSSEGKHVECIFCEGDHENAACEKAKRFSYESRQEIIKNNNCCYKCLKRGHRSKFCRGRLNCSRCGKRHALLVCPPGGLNESTASKTDKTNAGEGKISEKNLASFCNLPNVYLQTLRVIMFSDSREISVRAVIDSGSQRSYIRAGVAKFLDYKAVGKNEVTHALFGGVSTQSQTHNVYLARMRSIKGDYACNFQVMDQEKICSEIPIVKKAPWFSELKDENISLTDVVSGESDSINLLIGADVAAKLMTGRKRELSNGLTAVETLLGWTVMGKICSEERADKATTALSMFVSEAKISDLWSLDVLGIESAEVKRDRDLKEKAVQTHFLETVSFNENKRYTVNLPWIEDRVPVSSNFELAKRRLNNTEKRLEKEGLRDAYDAVFKEWLDEDIIERVPDDDMDIFCHYLPHRAVVKASSTTKIRPVFDASASEKGFPSLNACLEKGPNLIELIPDTLLRFREHDIAVVADVRKAFLQIEVSSKDRDFLRFLWHVDGKPESFRHKRVVFGLTCSPFLLGAVLEFHLENAWEAVCDERIKIWSKDIIEKLKRSFYVDNCITSVDSLGELNSFMSQAKDIMNSGGFDLRGWEYTHDASEKNTTLVLGLLYNKQSDTISINPSILENQNDAVITKRIILAAAHKVFDLVGFTAPVTLLPKLLLKRLWKIKIGWDDPVDSLTRKDFEHWHTQLHYLNAIEIPRKFGKGDYSLHTFCDASKLAYAAVTFLRVENRERVELKFLAAKARVAPEETTIPRLELLAASIGSRQTQGIIKALEYDEIPVFYWSDSTTVLAWIDRDVQWGVFVQNRIREIRKLTTKGKWRYVPGNLNPADLPSRGCQAKQLLESRWWEGPDWLCQRAEQWPCLSGAFDESEVNSERGKLSQVSMINKDEQLESDISKRFSSYHKLIRFLAIMWKFKNFKLKSQVDNRKGLSYSEVCNAELKYLKCLQKEMFSSERDPKLASLQTCIHDKNYRAHR